MFLSSDAHVENMDIPKSVKIAKSRGKSRTMKRSQIRTAGVTGQQRMLTPQRHLILPLHFF
jgi:hypothetical protein